MSTTRYPIFRSLSTTNTSEQSNIFSGYLHERNQLFALAHSHSAFLLVMDSNRVSQFLDWLLFSDDSISFSSAASSFKTIANFQRFWSSWIHFDIVTAQFSWLSLGVTFGRSRARIDSELFHWDQQWYETWPAGMLRTLRSCSSVIRSHVLVQARSSSSTARWCPISRSTLASDRCFAETND